ncbi:type II toxin-antitoxin system HigB family toxin [Bacteroidota bacterium]
MWCMCLFPLREHSSGWAVCMRILDKRILLEFCESHAGLRPSANRWLCVLESALWLNPNDLKATFPTASLIDSRRVVFNLGGNRYRVLAKIYYSRGIIRIVLVGTHAEYSRWKL